MSTTASNSSQLRLGGRAPRTVVTSQSSRGMTGCALALRDVLRDDLHGAAMSPQSGAAKKVVWDLLQPGFQPDINGCNPLHTAAKHGNAAAAEFYLQLGADANARVGLAADGLAPLHLAAAGGHEEAIATLLRGGANPNLAGGGSNCTALHLAAREGHPLAIKALLAGGADAGARDWFGNTPLHLAAYSGELAAAVALLAAVPGLDLDFQSKSGRTALMCAVCAGHSHVVQALAAMGASLAVQDAGGWTALHHAAASADFYAVEALLKAGAPLGIKDKDGKGAEDLAVAEVAELLRRQKTKAA